MTVFLLLEYIGIFAFSIAASITAIDYRLDLFGIYVLSVITSLGGGIIRDILIGTIPPIAFTDISYCLVSIGATTCFVIFLIIATRKRGLKRSHLKNKTLQDLLIIFDAFGLGIFTIAGTRIAIETVSANNPFLSVFVGVMTGVGGGVLRDVLVNRKPILLTREIYALASIAGSIVYLLVYKYLPPTVSLYGCSLLIAAVRLLSVFKKIDLPHLNLYESRDTLHK